MCATSAARFETHYAYSSAVDFLLLVACPSSCVKAEQFFFALNICNITMEKFVFRIKANAEPDCHIEAAPSG